MGTTASQITRFTIVYWTVYSGADERKHQSSVSLAFVRGIHRSPVNSLDKGPVKRKMFPFDDVIMLSVLKCIFLIRKNRIQTIEMTTNLILNLRVRYVGNRFTVIFNWSGYILRPTKTVNMISVNAVQPVQTFIVIKCSSNVLREKYRTALWHFFMNFHFSLKIVFFFENHSIHIDLLTIMKELFLSFGNKEYVLCVFADFQRALDKVDCVVLLDKF